MIAVRDTKAAKLLDMPVKSFRRLVERKILPGPVLLDDMERWRVKDIEAILDGSAVGKDDDFEP